MLTPAGSRERASALVAGAPVVDTGPAVKKLAAVLVAVALALYFLYGGTDSPQGQPAASGPAGGQAAGAEIVRERLEARARGEVNVSPCSATGRIVDAGSGRGIAGALVMLRPRGLGKPLAPGESGAPITATTDEAGEWSVPMIAPGRYLMTATAPEYLPGERRDLSLRAGGDNPGLDLALARGGHPLRGTVSDVSGGPIEGAVISIDREGDGNVIDFDRVSFPTLTDAEGRFVVQVPDGVYQVEAWHSDYTSDDESVDVAGGPRSVSLRLTPAGTIEGVVRTTQDGAPVEGAIVSGQGFAGPIGEHSALTDAQGRFRLANMRSGAHKLQAVAAGYASNEPVKLELGIGEALTGVEIRVDRAYKITGFVVPRDDPKKALGGVVVAAYSLNPMLMHASTGPSEVDGYFEIFGVKPGTYTLGSIAEDALPEILGGPSVTVEKADVTGVLVQLDRGVELRGRVSPPTPASVSLTLAEDEPGFLSVVAGIGNMFVRSRADAAGEFRLRPVKPGKLRIVAEALDGSRGQADVEVGERGLDGVTVVLEPRATVQGRIVDARGTPLRSGSVEYQQRKRRDDGFSFSFGGRDRSRAPIGEDGTYTLRGLDGGEYDVRVLDRADNVIRWAGAEDRPYEPVRKTIAAAVATPGLDFTVEVRDGSLRGVVLDPSGGPLADAWVTATPERSSDAEDWFHRPEADKPAERAGAVPPQPKDDAPKLDIEDFGFVRGEPVLSGEDGRFEFTGLARRNYTLRVDALKGSARARLAGVAVGSDVRLQVAPLAELSGTVRASDRPVGRYALNVRRKSGGFSPEQENINRPDGSFHRDHLDPGTYLIIVTADAGRVEHEVEIKAGEHARVTLDLKPWAKLRGVLLDARTGQPLAGMSVTAQTDDRFEPGMMFDSLLGKGPRTDATGRFEVTRIAPGKGELEIYDGDLTARRVVAEIPYEVEAGADKDLGTLHGVSHAKVPKAERGELGLRLLVASEARRPQPPGTKVEPLKEKEDPSARTHLYVSAVTIDGPADKAGLQPGDELLAIDGVSVASLGVDNAERVLSAGNVRRGQSIALEIERAGSRETVTLEAAERPQPDK